MDAHERYQHATEYKDTAERFTRRGRLSRDPDTRRAEPVYGFAPASQIVGFDPIKVRRISETTRQTFNPLTGRWA